jgi:hypothetical protein
MLYQIDVNGGATEEASGQGCQYLQQRHDAILPVERQGLRND